MGKRQFHLNEDEIKALRQAEQQTQSARELRHFQAMAAAWRVSRYSRY